jgi:hypothetical protein
MTIDDDKRLLGVSNISANNFKQHSALVVKHVFCDLLARCLFLAFHAKSNCNYQPSRDSILLSVSSVRPAV